MDIDETNEEDERNGEKERTTNKASAEFFFFTCCSLNHNQADIKRTARNLYTSKPYYIYIELEIHVRPNQKRPKGKKTKQKNNQKRVKAKVCCSEEFKDEQKKRAMFWTLYNGNVDCFSYNITYTRRNKKRTRDKRSESPAAVEYSTYTWAGKIKKKGRCDFLCLDLRQVPIECLYV